MGNRQYRQRKVRQSGTSGIKLSIECKGLSYYEYRGFAQFLYRGCVTRST
ncbi:hypothetical protein ACFLX3_04445 [Chloroflexota bacterium]